MRRDMPHEDPAHPASRSLLAQSQGLLEEILVDHIDTLPALLDPALGPFSEAIDGVAAVTANLQIPGFLFDRLEGGNDGLCI